MHSRILRQVLTIEQSYAPPYYEVSGMLSSATESDGQG